MQESLPSGIFDPRAASAIADLELVSRRVAEGFISGVHPSPYYGFAIEFAAYRDYVPGDDLRFLDWRVWGRTDRHYIKQFEETTNLSCFIFVDCSASMAIREDNGVSKFHYALMAAGALGYLISRQGDNVGLYSVSAGEPDYIPPKGGRRHLFSILAHLARLEPAGAVLLPHALNSLAERISHRGMVLLFSDFLWPTGELVQALKQLFRRRSDLILFEIMTSAEQLFPYDGMTEFEDVEVGARMLTQSTLVRDAYLQAMHDHRESLRRAVAEYGGDVVPITPAMSLASVLPAYLARRARLL
ncbi:MAG: DUF58 domain-containing protein [Planctomycetes bacterium]|nr:DUF58 domain-containing protein [Planctomycetota bacterium]